MTEYIYGVLTPIIIYILYKIIEYKYLVHQQDKVDEEWLKQQEDEKRT